MSDTTRTIIFDLLKKAFDEEGKIYYKQINEITDELTAAMDKELDKAHSQGWKGCAREIVGCINGSLQPYAYEKVYSPVTDPR